MVIGTRWGEDDLMSYIRENEGYKFFDKPALDGEGEPLFKIFYDKEKLADIESQIGPYMFSCLYLNRPLDASLRTFKSEWFQYLRVRDIPKDGDDEFITLAVDPAISEKDAGWNPFGS